jgi:DNA processing protein
VEYGGRTVAVFGCGLDVIYPPENDKLYEKILTGGGLVLSEYSPWAKPHLWKFPQRNRIVAGLASLGVLVIEAGEKSGSLITVELAEGQGKKIFALPGQVTSPVSRGTNVLIRDGRAKLVMGVEDILPHFAKASRGEEISLEGIEKEIWETLAIEALNTDEIAVTIGKSVVEVGTTLSLMGIKGLVSESGGKWYLAKD